MNDPFEPMSGDAADTPSTALANRWAQAAIALGAIALATSWPLAVRGLSRVESTLFDEVNSAPRWLAITVWPIMQTGTIWMAGVTALVIAIRAQRSRRGRSSAQDGSPAGGWLDTIVAGLLGGLTVAAAWFAATVAKRAVERGRPAFYRIGNDVFGEAAHGFGYVSGHTAVAFAAATVLGRGTSTRVRLLLYCVASVVGVSRIVVGSHLPLDVVGGAGVGLVCGGIGALVMNRFDDIRCPDGV